MLYIKHPGDAVTLLVVACGHHLAASVAGAGSCSWCHLHHCCWQAAAWHEKHSIVCLSLFLCTHAQIWAVFNLLFFNQVTLTFTVLQGRSRLHLRVNHTTNERHCCNAWNAVCIQLIRPQPLPIIALTPWQQTCWLMSFSCWLLDKMR